MKNKKARAYAPGNISCIFRIHSHKDPSRAGSTGLGFTVNKGVSVEASCLRRGKKNVIVYNGKSCTFATVDDVARNLTLQPLHIEIRSALPPGTGFGISGASALATAYAINTLLSLDKSRLDLAKLAHFCEVKNGTGLGDVINQYFGGVLLKTVPSCFFEAVKLSVRSQPVYCRFFSGLDTKSVISSENMKKKINRAAGFCLQKIEVMVRGETFRFTDLIALSKKFSLKSGLLMHPEAVDTIDSIESNGGHASMIMLGNAVFSDRYFKGSEELKISKQNAKVID